MRKMTWLAAALSFAAVLAFVGCENTTNSDDGLTGVLGQVAGVVYDSTTGLPIPDAEVAIGRWSATTGEGGSYVIEDVIPGEYTLTVWKDGFTSYTLNNVEVKATQYLTDDPYMEADYLREQIELFENWLVVYQTINGIDYPTYDGLDAFTSNGEWTYGGNGVFVSEDGSAQVTITESGASDSAFPRFEVLQTKLDYTYRYGIRADLITLTPMTGGVKGKLEVVFEVNDKTLALSAAEPIKEGVEIYFYDPAKVQIETGGAATGVIRQYGPYKTQADGTFVADKLPAKTRLWMLVQPFAQKKGGDGAEYYFVADKFFTHASYAKSNGASFKGYDIYTSTGNKEYELEVPTGETDEEGNLVLDDEGNPVTAPQTFTEGYTDIGNLVIFTVGDVAYVTGGNVPNADAPLTISGATPGAITLTFNKAIDAGTFDASLELTNNAYKVDFPVAAPAPKQSLAAEWNAAKTTVTLRAGSKLDNYAAVSFPYSIRPGEHVGTVTLKGVAADGSEIYAGFEAGTDLKLFTEQGLAVELIEYLSAEAAASYRAAISEVGGAIKLTFNKDLDKNYGGTKFIIAAAPVLPATPADLTEDPLVYRFDANNPRVVYAFTDNIQAKGSLYYWLATTADYGSLVESGTELKLDLTIVVKKAVLLSTDLYTNLSGAPTTPSAVATFPPSGDISFTFADAIPDNAKVVAELKDNSGVVPTTVSYSNGRKTATVAPAQLTKNTAYTLKLWVVRDDAVLLYETPKAARDDSTPPAAVAGPVGPLYINANDEIAFRTATQEVSLVSTDLYTGLNDLPLTPSNTGIFPASRGTISFTFDNIPDDATAVATLTQAGSVIPLAKKPEISDDRKVVTVTPAQLKKGTAYALKLYILNKAKVTIYESPDAARIGTPPAPTAGAVGALYINASDLIAFTTLAQEINLFSTDLYTDLYEVQKDPPDDTPIFPVSRGSIKFVFDAAIPENPKVIIKLTDAAKVVVDTAYNISDDGKTLTVTPDADLLTAGASYTLTLTVANSDGVVLYQSPDAARIGTPPAPTAGAVGALYINASDEIAFTTAVVQGLNLASTNLYTDRDGIVQTPSAGGAGEGIFTVTDGGKITFTFDRVIPADAKVIAELKAGNKLVTAFTGLGTKTLEIAPVAPVELKRDTVYTLSLEILDKDQTSLYKNPSRAGTPPAAGPVGSLYIDANDLISFRTSDVKAIGLASTNLYIDPVTGIDASKGSVHPTDALYNFATNDGLTPAGAPAIELIFDAEIPAAAVKIAVLKDATGNTVILKDAPDGIVVDGKKITITPKAPLKANAQYYLSLQLLDTTNGKYWEVPAQAATTIVNSSAKFGGQYIGFSTQKASEIVLVSANLYKDIDGDGIGDVESWSEPYFRRDGTIELTFENIPAGARIADLALNGTADQALNATTHVSVYARIDGNTVKITPNAPLAVSVGTGTVVPHYYLKFKLYLGTVKIWELPTKTDFATSGPYGPVQLTSSTVFNEITITTVSQFRLTSGSTSLTNINTSGVTNNFNAGNNIVLEFDRPIKSVEKAILLYNRNITYGTTASAAGTAAALKADGNLSEDLTVLTVKTTNLLAPNANFLFRLKVESEDGQTLVYDTTDTGDTATYAGATKNSDRSIIVDVTPVYNKVNGKDVASGGTLAINPTSGVTNTPDPITVDLTLTPLSVSFNQNYVVQLGRQGVWTSTGSTIPVLAATTAAVGPVTVTIPAMPAGETKHVNAENIQYKVRGISNAGYVSESTTVNVSFAP